MSEPWNWDVFTEYDDDSSGTVSYDSDDDLESTADIPFMASAADLRSAGKKKETNEIVLATIQFNTVAPNKNVDPTTLNAAVPDAIAASTVFGWDGARAKSVFEAVYGEQEDVKPDTLNAFFRFFGAQVLYPKDSPPQLRIVVRVELKAQAAIPKKGKKKGMPEKDAQTAEFMLHRFSGKTQKFLFVDLAAPTSAENTLAHHFSAKNVAARIDGDTFSIIARPPVTRNDMSRKTFFMKVGHFQKSYNMYVVVPTIISDVPEYYFSKSSLGKLKTGTPLKYTPKTNRGTVAIEFLPLTKPFGIAKSVELNTETLTSWPWTKLGDSIDFTVFEGDSIDFTAFEGDVVGHGVTPIIAKFEKPAFIETAIFKAWTDLVDPRIETLMGKYDDFIRKDIRTSASQQYERHKPQAIAYVNRIIDPESADNEDAMEKAITAAARAYFNTESSNILGALALQAEAKKQEQEATSADDSLENEKDALEDAIENTEARIDDAEKEEDEYVEKQDEFSEAVGNFGSDDVDPDLEHERDKELRDSEKADADLERAERKERDAEAAVDIAEDAAKKEREEAAAAAEDAANAKKAHDFAVEAAEEKGLKLEDAAFLDATIAGKYAKDIRALDEDISEKKRAMTNLENLNARVKQLLDAIEVIYRNHPTSHKIGGNVDAVRIFRANTETAMNEARVHFNAAVRQQSRGTVMEDFEKAIAITPGEAAPKGGTLTSDGVVAGKIQILFEDVTGKHTVVVRPGTLFYNTPKTRDFFYELRPGGYSLTPITVSTQGQGAHREGILLRGMNYRIAIIDGNTGRRYEATTFSSVQSWLNSSVTALDIEMVAGPAQAPTKATLKVYASLTQSAMFSSMNPTVVITHYFLTPPKT